jgi:hypothetical protein
MKKGSINSILPLLIFLLVVGLFVFIPASGPQDFINQVIDGVGNVISSIFASNIQAQVGVLRFLIFIVVAIVFNGATSKVGAFKDLAPTAKTAIAIIIGFISAIGLPDVTILALTNAYSTMLFVILTIGVAVWAAYTAFDKLKGSFWKNFLGLCLLLATIGFLTLIRSVIVMGGSAAVEMLAKILNWTIIIFYGFALWKLLSLFGKIKLNFGTGGGSSGSGGSGSGGSGAGSALASGLVSALGSLGKGLGKFVGNLGLEVVKGVVKILGYTIPELLNLLKYLGKKGYKLGKWLLNEIKTLVEKLAELIKQIKLNTERIINKIKELIEKIEESIADMKTKLSTLRTTHAYVHEVINLIDKLETQIINLEKLISTINSIISSVDVAVLNEEEIKSYIEQLKLYYGQLKEEVKNINDLFTELVRLIGNLSSTTPGPGPSPRPGFTIAWGDLEELFKNTLAKITEIVSIKKRLADLKKELKRLIEEAKAIKTRKDKQKKKSLLESKKFNKLIEEYKKNRYAFTRIYWETDETDKIIKLIQSMNGELSTYLQHVNEGVRSFDNNFETPTNNDEDLQKTKGDLEVLGEATIIALGILKSIEGVSFDDLGTITVYNTMNHANAPQEFAKIKSLMPDLKATYLCPAILVEVLLLIKKDLEEYPDLI